jgi:hypothetical protein
MAYLNSQLKCLPGVGQTVALSAYGLLASPAAWAAQLLVNYALASHACFPSGTMREGFLVGWEHIWAAMSAINIICMLIALSGVTASAYLWTKLQRGPFLKPEHFRAPGEGLAGVAAWAGLLVASLFSIAIIFNTIYLSALSKCSLA